MLQNGKTKRHSAWEVGNILFSYQLQNIRIHFLKIHPIVFMHLINISTFRQSERTLFLKCEFSDPVIEIPFLEDNNSAKCLPPLHMGNLDQSTEPRLHIILVKSNLNLYNLYIPMAPVNTTMKYKISYFEIGESNHEKIKPKADFTYDIRVESYLRYRWHHFGMGRAKMESCNPVNARRQESMKETKTHLRDFQLLGGRNVIEQLFGNGKLGQLTVFSVVYAPMQLLVQHVEVIVVACYNPTNFICLNLKENNKSSI